MDRIKPSPWILVSAGLALVALLCFSNLLLMPYSGARKPLLPSVLTLIFNWMYLGLGRRSALAELFILPIPLAILVTNLTILIIAQELKWRPICRAWVALSAPAAILASVLMAFAASLPFFTSMVPWVLAVVVVSLLILWIAKRKGWRPLWPWVVTLVFSGAYVFLVLLSLLLYRLGVVHTLL